MVNQFDYPVNFLIGPTLPKNNKITEKKSPNDGSVTDREDKQKYCLKVTQVNEKGRKKNCNTECDFDLFTERSNGVFIEQS